MGVSLLEEAWYPGCSITIDGSTIVASTTGVFCSTTVVDTTSVLGSGAAAFVSTALSVSAGLVLLRRRLVGENVGLENRH